MPKGNVNAALACFITAWTLPAVLYLAAVRAPYSKPAPTRRDK